MHPVKRLRELLAPAPAANRGALVAIEGDSLTVATARGTAQYRRLPGDATGYKPGDTVRLDGGAVTGRTGRGARRVYVV